MGVTLAALALLTVILSGIGAGSGGPAAASTALTVLSFGLMGAIITAYQFPIHLRWQTRVHMSSVAFYLLAVLLPPPVAAVAAGVGTLLGELSVCRQRDLHASDIATQCGRRVLVVWLASLVAHLPLHDLSSPLMLVGAALALGLGDIVTLPLLLAPMSGERPLRILFVAAREVYLIEGTQYVLGLLGALAAQQLWALTLLLVPVALAYRAFKCTVEMQDSTRALLERMADTVDLRDINTGGHSRRVTAYVDGILRELGVQGPEAALILVAARVHDIGKIGIPDSVLKKPGPLTAEERAVMETHAEQGATLLQRYRDFARGAEIVLHHHEAWDGSGYPHGLVGAEIPFGARVVAVADSIDAMTNDRPYRRGMPIEQACAVLRQGRGQLWEPAVVDAFLRSIAPQLRPALKARGTVLVVDDDPTVVAFLEEALAEDGYRVLATLNTEAVELARTQRPDLILLDLLMPGMDGEAVSRHLRDDPVTSDIPIVVMSGRDQLNNASRVPPVDDRLPKPFELDRLYKTVERWTHSS